MDRGKDKTEQKAMLNLLAPHDRCIKYLEDVVKLLGCSGKVFLCELVPRYLAVEYIYH